MLDSYIYVLGAALLGIFLFYLALFLLGHGGEKIVYPFTSGEFYKPVRIPYRVNFIYYVALFAAFETFVVLVMFAFIARIIVPLLIYLLLVFLALLMAPKVIAR